MDKGPGRFQLPSDLLLDVSVPPSCPRQILKLGISTAFFFKIYLQFHKKPQTHRFYQLAEVGGFTIYFMKNSQRQSTHYLYFVCTRDFSMIKVYMYKGF